MNYVLLISGVALVGLVTCDIVQTALRLAQRGGPLTLLDELVRKFTFAPTC